MPSVALPGLAIPDLLVALENTVPEGALCEIDVVDGVFIQIPP
jgi:hypothetical protein